MYIYHFKVEKLHSVTLILPPPAETKLIHNLQKVSTFSLPSWQQMALNS